MTNPNNCTVSWTQLQNQDLQPSILHVFLRVSRKCLTGSQKSSVSTALLDPVAPTRILLIVYRLSPDVSLPSSYVLTRLQRPSLPPPCPPSANATLQPSRSQRCVWALRAVWGITESCLLPTASSKAALFQLNTGGVSGVQNKFEITSTTLFSQLSFLSDDYSLIFFSIGFLKRS